MLTHNNNETPFTKFSIARSHIDPDWTHQKRIAPGDLRVLFGGARRGSKNGPCYSPATFRNGRRHLNDAEEIGIAVLDVDGGHTFDEIRSACAGLEALIHTTYSHSDDTPRLRVLLPLASPWRATDYPSQGEANDAWRIFIMALAGRLGLASDQSCTDTARLFYFPRTRPGGPPYEFAYLSGTRVEGPKRASSSNGSYNGSPAQVSSSPEVIAIAKSLRKCSPKSSGGFLGCCPIHDDHDPCRSIRPSTERHCYTVFPVANIPTLSPTFANKALSKSPNPVRS